MGGRGAVAVIDEESIVVDAVLHAAAIGSSAVTHCVRWAEGRSFGGWGMRAALTKRSIISWTVRLPLPSSSSSEYSASN
jgi:hypothetical protein